MFDELKDTIINGNEKKARELTGAFLNAGKNPKDILDKGLLTGIEKVIMATIEGDVHDIGKNIVSMMLECCGSELTVSRLMH